MDNTIEFAGANNSIYIVRQKELMVFKGDKMPIGSYVDNTKKFTSQKISLCQNDMVYLNTDGYVDQFGGEKGKKFKAKQLEDLLVTVSVKSLEEQKNAISETFFAWKNDHEQTDDVSLIGIKIT
jgi:serine phosphatase RsbU (regulator of sigma subunit)